MAQFIRIVVAGTETLVNLANVVTIQFWVEGEYRRPHATIVTSGLTVPDREADSAVPHTITVQDDGPIAALREELQRAGALPPETDLRAPDGAAREAERLADQDVAEPSRDDAIIGESMPAAGPKFDRGRPHRGYGRPE